MTLDNPGADPGAGNASPGAPAPAEAPAPFSSPPGAPESLVPEPAGAAPIPPGALPGPGAPRPVSLGRRILLLPPVRLIVALVFVLLPQGLLSRFVLRGQVAQNGLLDLVASVLLVHLAYVAYVRWVERRPVTELALRSAPMGLAWGALLGAGLIAVVAGLLWLPGYFVVTGSHGLAVLAPVFALSVKSGYMEEVVSRGIVFRITEDGLGTWLSTAFSALLFGFLHAANPNATLLSSVSIAASAGVLLAGMYALTRRLWPVIGLHFAWNFTEGGIFGIPISGFDVDGLLESRTQGPEVLTGGAFGIEASVLVLVLGLALGAAFLFAAVRQGRIVPPFWRRRALEPAPLALPGPTAF